MQSEVDIRLNVHKTPTLFEPCDTAVFVHCKFLLSRTKHTLFYYLKFCMECVVTKQSCKHATKL